MLKGYQRKLIMIRTTESSIFESAFFILRGSRQLKAEDDDMIAEANRIIDSGGLKKMSRNYKKKHILLSACIGFLAGAAAVAVVWLAAVI